MSNFSLALILGISVIAIAGGLTLLIIGLIQNKSKLWVPGLTVFVIAFIIGIIGAIFSFRNLIVNIAHNTEKFKNHINHYHNSNIFSDTTYDMNTPVDSTFSEQVSGFVNDTDNSLIYIKVFPKKELSAKGLIVKKVNKDNIGSKVISLMLSFHKDFNINIKLTAFDYKKKKLGSSQIKVNRKEGEISSMNFSFPDDVNLSLTDYCTLTEAD
ncbi:MAG: hypothetical protein ABR968_03160 [Bacteroidales bacterium]|jgi:hypothetical protein